MIDISDQGIWTGFPLANISTFTSREISYLERSKGDGLLVVVVPGAPELPGLVPDLLDQGVILDDDGVLHVAPRGVGLPVGLRVPAARHPATVQEDLETGGDGSWSRGQVDTVGVAVEAFAEDHAIEGSVKLDIDPDAALLTLNLNILDLGQIRLSRRPNVIGYFLENQLIND